MHDLLANHRDIQTTAGYPQEQISTSGFHCHVDDLVVVAPFLPEMQSADLVILTSVPVLFSEPLSHFSCLFLLHSDSRGPPATFCS